MSENARIVLCEACGSEGYERETVWVYEHGCGFAHEDVVLNYNRPCSYCEGTGGEIIETEPIDEDDLDDWSPPERWVSILMDAGEPALAAQLRREIGEAR